MTQQSTEYDPKRNHFFIQVNETKYTCKELNHIVRSYYKAVEALKFYAADENYYMRGTYGKTNVRDDNGKIAKEALREIEK